MQIKLNGSDPTAKNLAKAKAVFTKYNPDYPFDPKFIDEEYARKFESEKTQGILAGLFAGLTIFISCLGLFGLATYMAENRIKEIGIRKVLGASVTGITTLLSKDFIKLVIISFFIAAPLAWWGMYSWLQGYTYRVSIDWWVFALAGFLSVMIALLTVSYQSIKAAVANPVKSLKAE
jgi:ABC-type antimicrobial peptide transport system permease subunit